MLRRFGWLGWLGLSKTLGGIALGKMNCLEAAELLGMSERHFPQLPKGAEGIVIAVAAGPPGGGRPSTSLNR